MQGPITVACSSQSMAGLPGLRADWLASRSMPWQSAQQAHRQSMSGLNLAGCSGRPTLEFPGMRSITGCTAHSVMLLRSTVKSPRRFMSGLMTVACSSSPMSKLKSTAPALAAPALLRESGCSCWERWVSAFSQAGAVSYLAKWRKRIKMW